jgi:cytochrome c oxidase cbb3-type subunit 3
MQQRFFQWSLLAVAIMLTISMLLIGCSSEPSGADLYALNCASCHGAAGKGGMAKALADSTYFATHDDATMVRLTSEGVPNTVMRAFSQTKGGTLNNEQINAIVKYLRSN